MAGIDRVQTVNVENLLRKKNTSKKILRINCRENPNSTHDGSIWSNKDDYTNCIHKTF